MERRQLQVQMFRTSINTTKKHFANFGEVEIIVEAIETEEQTLVTETDQGVTPINKA